jgi:hypothetical protein
MSLNDLRKHFYQTTFLNDLISREEEVKTAYYLLQDYPFAEKNQKLLISI